MICSFGFDSDHRADVTKLRAMHVDAIISAEWTDQVMRLMREQHFNAKLLGTSNVIEALRLRNPDNDLMEGVFFTDWQPSQEFVDRFKEKFGTEPILEADNSYEILRSIAKALASSDVDTLAALKKVRYQGVGSLIDFTAGMSANKGVGHLYQIRNRNVVAVN